MAGIFQAVRCPGEHATHVGDVRFDSTEPFEFAAGLSRDDLSEGSFAGAGRAVENEGLNAVGFDGSAEELTGAEDVGLAHELGESARAHPRGERLLAEDTLGVFWSSRWIRLGYGRKQVIRGHDRR